MVREMGGAARSRTSSMYSMTSVSFILFGMFCGRDKRRGRSVS